MKRFHLVFVVALAAAADFIPSTYAGFTTAGGGTTGPAPAKTETARNNNARRATDDINSKCSTGTTSASSSPLFRSASALFDDNRSRLSSAAVAAAVVAATANSTSKGINTRSKFDGCQNFTAIFQVVVQRISHFKSSLAATCNAAVAFLAAQYLGAVLLFGVAASSSLSSSSVAPLGAVGHSYDGNLPPMGPVAAVMRVAPAGASSSSSVASAYPVASNPRATSWDALRLCTDADSVKTVAGVSAAVAGATLGRKFFYEHTGNKGANDEQNKEEDASVLPTAPTFRSSISSSAEPEPSMTRELLQNALPITATDVTKNEMITDVSGCLETDRSLASTVLDDCGSAQKDFERMRHLLEARLQLEAPERKKSYTEQDKELFQRRLLEARIRQDAVDKALKKKERVRANTITPELMSTIKRMSTIKMLSEQEDSNAPTKSLQCADDVAGGSGALNNCTTSAGSTFLPLPRNGVRSALASVSAFFS